MKQVLLTLGLLTALTVNAGSVSIEHRKSDTTATHRANNGQTLTVKENVWNNFATADVSFDINHGAVGHANPNIDSVFRGSVGLTKNFGPLYVRGGVGRRVENTERNLFWNIEPGVIIPMSLPENIGHVDLQLAVRHQVDLKQRTETSSRVGVNYYLTKTDTVGLRVDKVFDGRQKNNTDFNPNNNGVAISSTKAF